ncbi:MAG: NAD(P)/FAD-dependent oxidoreductase [Acidobacteriia bacterium]|nr:NAD(P)/FAD-dependent oxidoreductase [Terriglobia bacterium]
MDKTRHECDVLVVGGGPAGLAAACSAAQAQVRVTIIDDNPGLGGQIWREEQRKQSAPDAEEWFKKVRDAKVERINGAKIFDFPEAGVLRAEASGGVYELSYHTLILATGARERFLPFPGWTLPNVMGAGGLQAMVKSGVSIIGKKVVVAGSGPLLLAVAAYLREQGADLRLIAEQAPRRRLVPVGLALCRHPRKLLQLVTLEKQLLGVRYLTSCWPVAAEGDKKLRTITLRQGSKTWSLACDYLACGFHLVANTELAALLDCELREGVVRVGDFQETSVDQVYCAGEATGIGGLELSIVEGQIAGYAATRQNAKAQALFAARTKLRRLALKMDRAFQLRDELKNLPRPETIVCRCEDITLEQLQTQPSWNSAKMLTRCGMGPCQGRICGSAVEFLFHWIPKSVRPPIFPVRLDSLASTSGVPESRKASSVEGEL